MHYTALIERIVRSKTGFSVREIKENHMGFDNMVYIVETTGGRLLVKFPTRQKRNKVLSEAWAFKAWSKLGVPMPKVLATGRDYLIEEFIEGRQMNEAGLSESETDEVMQELGGYAKKMHTVKTKGYGYLVREGEGGIKTWADFMDPFFKKIMAQLKTQHTVRDDLLNSVMDFYVKHSEGPLSFSKPCLTHSDLTQSNIIVEDGVINGIIDATSAISGDPMFDVAVVNQNCYGTELMESFRKGYGRIDEDRVLFYSLYQAVWLVHFASVQTRDAGMAKKAIESMLSYTGSE